MPKKGKGKKGKDKESADSGVPPPQVQDQPAASSRQAGRGRGRGGNGPPSQSTSQESVGVRQQVPKSPEPKSVFEVGDVGSSEQRPVAKGRGRGRGSPPQASSPKPPGLSPKDESEASAMGKGAASKGAHPKQKVLSPEEQDITMKMAGISIEHDRPVSHMQMAEKPTSLPLINDRNRIPLFVNYFRLKFKDISIYHYDIDISDSTKESKIGKSVLGQGRTAQEDKKKNVKFVEREKRRNMGKAKCREIIAELFKSNAQLKQYCPVYDGQKNLYTSKPLPYKKDPIPVDIVVEGKPKKFFVTIAPVEKEDHTNVISLAPLFQLYQGQRRSSEIPYEVLLVYETVMSHREPPFQQVHFRNSFFSYDGRKDPLGCGLEVWSGYHQSVILTEECPVVVINLAAKAFHKGGSVLDYASDVLNIDDITRFPKLNAGQTDALSRALRGLHVKVTHQRHARKYKIKNVMDRPARETMIDYQNRKISVVQYFADTYQKKLSFPNLPCLHMQTGSNTTYIPMETCVIVEGQPKIGKLSADLTAKMIKNTAVPPDRRMDTISKTVVKTNNISKKYMESFGLLMDLRLMKVDGRIIAAPQLVYHDKQHITKPDKKGVWRMEDGRKFFKINKIGQWVLMSFADERRFGHDILSKYCQFLVQSARKCGMQLDRPTSINIYRRETTEEAIIRAKKSGAQFAIVILNRRDNNHTYDEVKFLADFKHNLVTQCMEDKTLSRINDQITTNVCLKINVKLGGINHVFLNGPRVFREPITVLGVDAIHWPRGFGYPSILSVVGSLNPSAARYALICDLQRNEKHGKLSQEIIRNMENISQQILKTFADVNGRPPNRIVVYRDGVSEGQFQHALDYEVSGIQRACQNLFQKILPITFIVVQKRHHTRFFPQNPSQGVGRNLNVPPGTCVDREVTHPVFFDYFICSHEGIQGTSKPAHYTVLHNDNRFGYEELQELSYFLCHTYVRCTRSVSLPAPVMYADLAAARAKKYADLFIGSDSVSLSSGDSEQRDLPAQVEKAIRSMKSFENNMFYV